jgi:putative ABC transport system substrate-binding protein
VLHGILAAAYATAARAAGAALPLYLPVLGSPPANPAELLALRQALLDVNRELGERTVLQPLAASYDSRRLQLLAGEAVRRRPPLIVCCDLDAALAAKAARTNDMPPIVFRAHDDPVARGLIGSYGHPGRRLTGVTAYRCIDDKMLEILHDALPRVRRVGYLYDAANADAACHARAHLYARSARLELVSLVIPGEQALPSALTRLSSLQLDALLVPASASTWNARSKVIEQVDRLALPAIYEGGAFVPDGGLMQFGARTTNIHLQMARAMAAILRGGDAGAIPVFAPSEFELTVNLRARHARRYGISPATLRRADQIIE